MNRLANCLVPPPVRSACETRSLAASISQAARPLGTGGTGTYHDGKPGTTGDAPAARWIGKSWRVDHLPIYQAGVDFSDPGEDAEAPTAVRPGFAPVAGVPSRVLVVCDHADGSSALLGLLAAAGLEVLVVEDGAPGGLGFSEFWPDLVVLDLIAPGRNASAICCDLQGIPAFADISILFAAAPSDHLSRSACFAAGAIDFLPKPFTPVEVLARIKVHFELRQLRRTREAKGHLEQSIEAQLEQVIMQPVLVVNPTGHIVFCSRNARGLLSRHLEDFDLKTTLIPSNLHGGIFPRLAGCLELRVRRFTPGIKGTGDGGLTVLLLEEQAPDPSLVLLKALKLTRCEANILYWVREGKTSPEIATILGAALATVKKHLEHIYEKLGVETRTAAALLASEVLQRQEPV